MGKTWWDRLLEIEPGLLNGVLEGRPIPLVWSTVECEGRLTLRMLGICKNGRHPKSSLDGNVEPPLFGRNKASAPQRFALTST